MISLRQWLEHNKEWIASSTNIVTSLALVAGFGLTVCQIRRGTDQIRSANEYEIRKDVRDMTLSLKDAIDRPCLTKSMAGCPPKLRNDTAISLGVIFNLYHAVFEQYRLGGVSEEFFLSIGKDFCYWFKFPFVEEMWQQKIQRGIYSESRKRMRKIWCGE